MEVARIESSRQMEVARIESSRRMEVARIVSEKQSDRIFMMMMITLMNPRKAEDPPSLTEIQDYIEFRTYLSEKSLGWIILDQIITILFYVLFDLVYVCE